MVRAMVRHKALMCECEMQNQAIGSSGDRVNKDIGSSKIGPSGEPLNITVRSPDDPMTRYFLLSYHQHFKSVRQYGRSGARFLRCGRGFWAELRRDQIYIMRLFVQRHGARARFGRNILHDAELVGRVLMNYCQHALTAGSIGKAIL